MSEEDVFRRRELPTRGVAIEFVHKPAGPERKRDYRRYHLAELGGDGNGERRELVSVTTILGDVVPKHLAGWAEREGVAGAVRAAREGRLDGIAAEDAVTIVRELGYGQDASRDRSGLRGRGVHKAIEHYVKTGTIPSLADFPPAWHGVLRALAGWILRYMPEPLAAEVLVAHGELGYGGTYDLRAELVDGRKMLVDFKTKTRPRVFFENYLQLAGYDLAAQWCGEEPADGLMVVSLGANGRYIDREAFAGIAEIWPTAVEWRRSYVPLRAIHDRVERELAAA